MKTKLQNWTEVLKNIGNLQKFAKEFWGDAMMQPDDFEMSLYEWQYYLGKIVTAQEPAKEIKKFFNPNG